MGALVDVAGDIFARSGVLVHQCYCVRNDGRAAGLARKVRDRLGADPYEAGMRVPGSIAVAATRGPVTAVVHLYAQIFPGAATAGRDSAEARLIMFASALAKLEGKLTTGEIAEKTILVPSGIGCGLARGDWGHYRAAVADFAARLPAGYTVEIVQLVE